jgi:hypothetical protein
LIDPKYIVNIKGKEHVLYAGVLNAAHEKGILCLECTIVQFPSKENGNTCICRASLIGSDCKQNFTDYGDASDTSCEARLIPHLIRVACTRAKARVCRDYANIGMCTVEELNPIDIEESQPEPPSEAQLNLLKRLSKEKKVDINYASLDKAAASKLITELSQRRAG